MSNTHRGLCNLHSLKKVLNNNITLSFDSQRVVPFVFLQTTQVLHLDQRRLGFSIPFCKLSECHLNILLLLKDPLKLSCLGFGALLHFSLWQEPPLFPVARAVYPVVLPRGAGCFLTRSLPPRIFSSLTRFLPIPSHFLLIPTALLCQWVRHLKMQKSDFKPYGLSP